MPFPYELILCSYLRFSKEKIVPLNKLEIKTMTSYKLGYAFKQTKYARTHNLEHVFLITDFRFSRAEIINNVDKSTPTF